MPKISQYTVVEPQGEDKIIITQTIGSPEDATKNITVDDLKEYINQGGGGGNGVASLNTLTGDITLQAGANIILASDLNDTIIISAPNVVDKTTDQTIDGVKTFEKPIFLDDIASQGSNLKIEFVSSTFRVTNNSNNAFFGFQNDFFEYQNQNGLDARFDTSLLTGNKIYSLQDETGTLALTSDLSSLSADQEISDFNATIDQVGVMVDVNSATDVVVTVRAFSIEAIPVGSVLTYRQAGAGKLSNTYIGATGSSASTYRVGDVLTLWQKSQDNWVVINPPHAIDSQTTGEPTGSDQVLNVVSLTQAEYDAAVGSHNSDTLYVITS